MVLEERETYVCNLAFLFYVLMVECLLADAAYV